MASFIRDLRTQYPAIGYIAPFALFLIFLAIGAKFSLDTAWAAPARVLTLAAVCVICWPREISLRPVQPLASVAIGALVFVLWIGPEVLIPGYRQLPLFSNAIVGHTHSSIPAGALRDPWILFWRTIRAIVVVPIVEELFWRGWLMRWLINPNFQRIPLGSYAPFAFWITAVLFASEHGPYWDVGLLTGIIYNAWMVKTKSLADCIVMHAVTNGILSAYVIGTSQWQYWQ